MGRAFATGCAGLLLAALGGCSQFNMTTQCVDMAAPLREAMIPNARKSTAGAARLAAAIEVSALSEVATAYNSRTCQGRLTSRSDGTRADVAFRVEQAEGLQSWQVITVLPPISPELERIRTEALMLYGDGG